MTKDEANEVFQAFGETMLDHQRELHRAVEEAQARMNDFMQAWGDDDYNWLRKHCYIGTSMRKDLDEAVAAMTE